MKNEKETKSQLISELAELRCQDAKLDSSQEIYLKEHLILVNNQLRQEIKKRQETEKALKDQLHFLQGLIDTIPNPVFYKDVKGVFKGCNLAYANYIGLSKEEIIGKSVYDVYPKDLATVYYEMDNNLFSTAGTQIYESSFQVADGTRRNIVFNKATYHNTDGNVAGLVGVIVDITESKQMEKSLRLLEERFSKAFHASPCPITITSLKDGRFIDVNNCFQLIIKYQREEVIGRTTRELNIYEDNQDRDRLLKTISEHGSASNMGINFRTKSGEILLGLLSAEVIELNGEKCVLALFYNITELKKMETEMARLDRLNLIGEMAAGIGHEIRNPLTTVRGFLQLLGEKQENELYKQYYDLMIQELDRANGIITEFLFLTKNKAVEFKIQNINKIIRTILPLIEADAVSSNQCIQLDLQEVAEIPLNENEIRQLILNLVFNGLEAMPPEGTLTIRTFQEGQEVVLAIQDQGEGIKPDLLSKVGIPFFTTKDAGTGLGLAVCYSIAARHNASVKLVTGPTGTIFFVRFTGINQILEGGLPAF